MKFLVSSRKKPEKKELESILKESGFELSKTDPDYIIIYGGDGSLLYAERDYPGIPKIPIKGSPTSKTCFYSKDDLKKILEEIRNNQYQTHEYAKLKAEFKNHVVEALNEIQVHNKYPYEAIRFNVYVNGKLTHENIIGDGIIISSSFGSGGYYYSFGGEKFESGLGLGFNNPHERLKSYVTNIDTEFKIELLRGTAHIVTDNNPEMLSIKAGESVKISSGKNIARFLRFKDIKRC